MPGALKLKVTFGQASFRDCRCDLDDEVPVVFITERSLVGGPVLDLRRAYITGGEVTVEHGWTLTANSVEAHQKWEGTVDAFSEGRGDKVTVEMTLEHDPL